MAKRSLTGIKPTGTIHLGNYLGAMQPAMSLVESHASSLYFIADYHALTSVHDRRQLHTMVYDIAAAWLAVGLDPERTLIYRQSSVTEVFELSWILSCVLATGQLERGHAYKDAVARGDAPNAGIFNYPVLMAADILLYDTDVVPVGEDQRQHLEVARDVAARINHVFGEGTLVVPAPQIQKELVVPGLDGQKMSKSYGNVIPLFAGAKELKKTVMSIVTGSESLEAPKEPEGTTVFTLYKQVAGSEKAEELARKLRAGGYGWGHAKQDLVTALDETLGPMRERYQVLRGDEAKLDALLEAGATRARIIARATMERVRDAIGIALKK
ncbi:MAG TPA: tryptophan--tRNA ligase [Polyangiales bacterium]|nr:tryptophan--tRNA ligase [Polyangiales bacterium]